MGLPTDDEFITDAEINNAINVGLRTMASDFDWPWLQKVTTFSTVAGQQSYALPTDLVRVQTLYTSSDTINGFSLTSRQFEFIVNFLNVQAAMPSDFCIVANSVYLAPVPSDVFTMTLLYVCVDNTLSGDSDTSLVPVQYSDVVVTYAALQLAARMQDETRFQTYQALQKDWITRVSKNVIKSSNAPAINMRNDW